MRARIVTADQVACAADSPLLVDGNKVVLEEFEFSRVADAREVADWIAAHAVNDRPPRRGSRPTWPCSATTTSPISCGTPRKLSPASGWITNARRSSRVPVYQEFLPAETLFYSVVFAGASRREGDAKSAAEVLAYLQQNIELAGVIQIGGDETTGKGLCLVRLCHGKED